MEVLRHGNTYKEKECPGCTAILLYCETDIKHDNEEGHYYGEWHSSYKKYIICPECKKEIILSWVIDGEEEIK